MKCVSVFFRQVVVLYDYRAQRSDELNLFAGDEVSVLYKDTENWWMGELQDGQQGFFPSNYVAEEGMINLNPCPAEPGYTLSLQTV